MLWQFAKDQALPGRPFTRRYDQLIVGGENYTADLEALLEEFKRLQ